MEIPKTLVGKRLLLALALLAIFGIGWRLIPHIPNFAPVGAIALLAGSLLSKKHSLLLLLAVMFITDAVIGFYTGFMWTWLSLALVIPIGVAISKLSLITKASLGTISASLVFFIVSNFGVWLTSGMYPPSTAGLISCYILALPFFWPTLASNFLFSSVLLSLASYVQSRQPSKTAVDLPSKRLYKPAPVLV